MLIHGGEGEKVGKKELRREVWGSVVNKGDMHTTTSLRPSEVNRLRSRAIGLHLVRGE